MARKDVLRLERLCKRNLPLEGNCEVRSNLYLQNDLTRHACPAYKTGSNLNLIHKVCIVHHNELQTLERFIKRYLNQKIMIAFTYLKHLLLFFYIRISSGVRKCRTNGLH